VNIIEKAKAAKVCVNEKVGILTAQNVNELCDAVLEMAEALKFECGGRCAEQNPCNAKEVLTKFGIEI